MGEEWTTSALPTCGGVYKLSEVRLPDRTGWQCRHCPARKSPRFLQKGGRAAGVTPSDRGMGWPSRCTSESAPLRPRCFPFATIQDRHQISKPNFNRRGALAASRIPSRPRAGSGSCQHAARQIKVPGWKASRSVSDASSHQKEGHVGGRPQGARKKDDVDRVARRPGKLPCPRSPQKWFYRSPRPPKLPVGFCSTGSSSRV